MEQLQRLAADDTMLLQKAQTWVHERERDERWNRYRPIIVLTAATLLCLLLWWLSHR
jgi:hypothetical protein